MTTTVKLILAQPLVAGSPSLVCHMMGNRMLHRCTFAQGGPTTLGLDLGAELLLEVQSEGVLGKQRPTLRPGAGNDVHALRGPLGNPRARHIPQVDVQLEQA